MSLSDALPQQKLDESAKTDTLERMSFRGDMIDRDHAASRGARALRLVLGAGTLTAGWLVVGAVLGGSSAAAEEPVTGGLLGSVSSVVLENSAPAPQGVIADAVALVPSAAESVPDAVPQLATVVPEVPIPVVSDVSIAGSSISDVSISGIVEDVAAPVDGIVEALPIVPTVVGDAPVQNLTAPLTQLVDDHGVGDLGLVPDGMSIDVASDDRSVHASSTADVASPTELVAAAASFATGPALLPDTEGALFSPVVEPIGGAPPHSAPAAVGTAGATTGSGSAGGASALGDVSGIPPSPALLRDAAHAYDDERQHPPVFASDSTPD